MQQYQNMVFSTAMRLLANQTDAEDIAQETFLRAYEHFQEIRQSPTAGGWLKRVATNLCLNHLSRYRARWSFFTDLLSTQSDEEGETIEFAAPDDLAEKLEISDRHEVVEQALQKLPTAQRVSLVLYHLEGLRYEEIAAKLNVSLGKVKTDIFRAREALRKKLRAPLAEDVIT